MKPQNCAFLVILCLPCSLYAETEASPSNPAEAGVEDILPESADSVDPFAAPSPVGDGLPAVNPARAAEQRSKLRLRLETWETPALQTVRFLDGAADAGNLAKARAACLAGGSDARLVFNTTVGLDAHTQVQSSTIVERIYPTEYEPPELPTREISPEDARQGSDAWTNWLKAAGKHAVPTAFETRNTGETFEAIAQPVTVDAGTWDVTLSFESVKYLGPIHHGASDLLIEMPVFSTFRVVGLYRLREGEWRLLSVQNSPAALDGEVPEKNWVTLLRIDPAH